jgi:peptidoglycan/LPS O-acetylase OafA/YrhL
MVIANHVFGLQVGRWGVQLFFVISGFLLANFRENYGWSDFLLHRFLRLFPLAFLVITLFYRSNLEGIWSTLTNFLLIQNISWHASDIPGQWSISNEWIFSIILVFLGRLTQRKLLTLFMIIVSIQFVFGFIVWRADVINFGSDSNAYSLLVWLNTFNPISNLAFFIAGISLRLGYLRIKLSANVLLTVFLLCFLIEITVGNFMPIWIVSLTLLFNACTQLKIRSTPAQRVISQVGTLTYGMYFSHFLVIRELEKHGINSGGLVSEIFMFVAVTLISGILAKLTWHFFERPVLRKFSPKSI